MYLHRLRDGEPALLQRIVGLLLHRHAAVEQHLRERATETSNLPAMGLNIEARHLRGSAFRRCEQRQQSQKELHSITSSSMITLLPRVVSTSTPRIPAPSSQNISSVPVPSAVPIAAPACSALLVSFPYVSATNIQ